MKIAICLGSVPDTTTKVKFTGDNTAFDATKVGFVSISDREIGK